MLHISEDLPKFPLISQKNFVALKLKILGASVLTESTKIITNFSKQRDLIALSNLKPNKIDNDSRIESENMRSSPISIEEQFQNQFKQSIDGHIFNNTKVR